uniref:Uncharacterized protein n=1 Tax=viral metagenome TaxID=1070528 RepID=A0A6M3XK44_9ZZZZ
MAKLKLFLWQMGLYPDRCPYCGEGLTKTGHIKEFYQNYKCRTKDCHFNVEI